MIHKLKILGLALAAVSVSAMTASAAQAGLFEAEKYPATITGEQVAGKFTGTEIKKIEIFIAGSPLICKKVTFLATLSAESETLTVTPTYKECALGFQGVSIDFTKCDYLLHAGKTVGGGKEEIEVATDISCPNIGEEVHIKGGGCEVTLEQQAGLQLVTAKNRPAEGGSKDDVDVVFDLSGIKYNTKTKECFGSEEGTHANGTFKGVATFKGEEDPGPGAQIGITVT